MWGVGWGACGEQGGYACRLVAYAALMGIVITVTVVFFLITLIGTYLSRRSAYQWADNERDLAASARPIDGFTGEQAGGDPSPMADRSPARGAESRAAGYTSPVRSAMRQSQVVVSGFETSSASPDAADASSPLSDSPSVPGRTPPSA